MKRLNQIIATETQVKAGAQAKITTLHRTSDNPELYAGLTKEYQPLDEHGERLPSEIKRVQMNVPQQIEEARSAWSDFIDITFTKDVGNCMARADVMLNNKVVVKDAPVTFLLFLEKRLMDIATFISKLPILDDAYDWKLDPSTGIYKSNPVSTHRTKKVQKALVLYAATTEHPAQTQLITEDEIVGHYNTTKASGAIPARVKRQWSLQCDRLLRAVKEARERANLIEVDSQSCSSALFDAIFVE